LPLGAGADIGGAKSAPQKAFSHLLYLLYLTQVSIGGAKSSMAYSILRKIARFQSAVHSASLRFFLVKNKRTRLSVSVFQCACVGHAFDADNFFFYIFVFFFFCFGAHALGMRYSCPIFSFFFFKGRERGEGGDDSAVDHAFFF